MPDEISRWWSRVLSAREVVDVTDHVAVCLPCRDALTVNQSAEVVAKALRRLIADQPDDAGHLSAESLCRWIDGRLPDDDRGTLEAHLEQCILCRADADDLSGFTETLRSRSSRGWVWLSVAATLAIASIGGWMLTRSETSRSTAIRESGTLTARDEPRVLLRDGALLVDARGAVHGVTPEWQALAEEVLRSPTLHPSARALALVQRPERQRAKPASVPDVHLDEPLSTVVLSDRPTFRWTAKENAPVRIDVYDGRFDRVASSGTLHAGSWTPPAPLPRGRTLSWTVTRLTAAPPTSFPAPPEPPAVFLIATLEVVNEVAGARATGSHLLSGFVLWQAGLTADAVVEFATLARENPESPIARQLVESSKSGPQPGR